MLGVFFTACRIAMELKDVIDSKHLNQEAVMQYLNKKSESEIELAMSLLKHGL
jgi:hypothetical protein